MTALLITIIALALIFDYINGFHDAANSIATIVSTKVLTPFQAVLWAAVFNFSAFFIFKDHGVANTIAKTVKEDFITLPVIISGLIAAIGWNLLTWWFGIPSSSSHTLIGGFAGAAIAHAGFNSVNPEPVIKTVSFIVLAPLVGMLAAFTISLSFIISFKKGFLPKLLSISLIVLSIFAVSRLLVTTPADLLGLRAEHVENEPGVAVKEVVSNSSAHDFGLRKYDHILALDNIPIKSEKQLNKIFSSYQKNDSIHISIERDGAVTTLNSIYDPHTSSSFFMIVLHGHNFKWILLASIV